MPDMITMAKGINNGAVPMGAVARARDVHDTFIGAGAGQRIELFHGYTYSAHPVAGRRGDRDARSLRSATGLFDARGIEGGEVRRGGACAARRAVREGRAQSRAGRGHRTGFAEGAPGARAYEVFLKCFEAGRARALHRRHFRVLAAADHRGRSDRSALRHGSQSARKRQVNRRHRIDKE